jgi:PKHD-type hydroxylase
MVQIEIGGILDEAALEAIGQTLESDATAFASGAATAGSHARAVKRNEQAKGGAADAIIEKVKATLLAHPVFNAAARPKQLVRLLVSRYRPGMEYGTHIDDALIEGRRTDLSFTLFLNDPKTYDGGELVIEANDGESAIKLQAGHLILYPTTSLHRVNAVTRGERLAVVGWVRSLVRSGERRELLFDLDNAVAALRRTGAERAILDRLFKVRANLLRMWVED